MGHTKKSEETKKKKNSDLVSTALSDKMKKSQGNKTKMHHFLTKTRNKGHRGKKKEQQVARGKRGIGSQKENTQGMTIEEKLIKYENELNKKENRKRKSAEFQCLNVLVQTIQNQ